jgi:hypothetical protein
MNSMPSVTSGSSPTQSDVEQRPSTSTIAEAQLPSDNDFSNASLVGCRKPIHASIISSPYQNTITNTRFRIHKGSCRK